VTHPALTTAYPKGDAVLQITFVSPFAQSGQAHYLGKQKGRSASAIAGIGIAIRFGLASAAA
jgi:hypothetical protein